MCWGLGLGGGRLLFSFSCRECVRACECLACFCEILRDSGDGCRAVGSTYQTQEEPFLPAMAVAAVGEKAGVCVGGSGGTYKTFTRISSSSKTCSS